MNLLWGAVMLGSAAIAYTLVARARDFEEITHVEAAAAYLWSLAGVLWVSVGAANLFNVSADATKLLAVSLHTWLVLRSTSNSNFIAPRRLARLTGLVLSTAVLWIESGKWGLEPYLTLAEIVAIATALWSLWLYRDERDKSFLVLTAIVTYLALLTVDDRVLGVVFRPLVTANYALMGTLLLFAGRRLADGAWARRLGGLTLVLVIGRLLIIDLSGLETIWRVLLFLGIGALFLFTSYRLQNETKNSSATAEPAA